MNELLQPACLPRIPIGSVVRTDFMGLRPANEPGGSENTILGCRLDPSNPEEGEHGLNLWPKGWEYCLGTIEGSEWDQRLRVYGWVSEEELIRLGYLADE